MTETVTRESCELHRQLMDTKIKGLDEKVNAELKGLCDRVDANEGRMNAILTEVQGVRDLQKQILYALIFISAGVALTLLGVVVGRGVDFGWLIT